jgi:hypothetical protein
VSVDVKPDQVETILLGYPQDPEEMSVTNAPQG